MPGWGFGARLYRIQYLNYVDEDYYTDFTDGVPSEPGRYAFYLEGNGGSYTGQSRPYDFEIVEGNDLSAAKFVFPNDNEVLYTGKKVIPTYSVVFGGKTLKEGEDYDVVYRDEYDEPVVSPTAIGYYSIEVTPHAGSDYVGTAWGSFSIVRSYYNAKSLKGAQITVAKAPYTGKALKPKVTVKLDGVVVPASGYDVTYRDNVKVGTGAIAIVNGKGNYCGTEAATFAVTKGNNPMTVKGKTVKAKKDKKTTIKATKAFTVRGAQGKVTYKKANKAGKSKITVAKNGKITVKKGLKKGIYKVKVKVTAAGNGNYNKATKTVVVKIKVK